MTTGEKNIGKKCLSCGEDGHTYNECTRMPFLNMACAAFGVTNILGPQPESKPASTLRKRVDIVDKLYDLHMQATVERSHFYVGSCCTEAIQEIMAMRQFLEGLQSAIEAEGYAIMVGVNGGFVELAVRGLK